MGDLMLLLTLIFLFCVVYDLISSINEFDWHSFDESLYISPYPTLYNYVCHYFIDVMVLFVLIVWLYSPSKCCTHIQMDSLIAHLCCVCCLVEEMENEGINNQIYFVDHDHEFRVKDYRKMCDSSKYNLDSCSEPVHDEITKLSTQQTRKITRTHSVKV